MGIIFYYNFKLCKYVFQGKTFLHRYIKYWQVSKFFLHIQFFSFLVRKQKKITIFFFPVTYFFSYFLTVLHFELYTLT